MVENIKETYFDDEEIGTDRKTSHPNFVEAFNDNFYYDCTDEEAPFGNDNGADTLYELEDYYRNGNYVMNLPTDGIPVNEKCLTFAGGIDNFQDYFEEFEMQKLQDRISSLKKTKRSKK